jgi:hypothetical protein
MGSLFAVIPLLFTSLALHAADGTDVVMPETDATAMIVVALIFIVSIVGFVGFIWWKEKKRKQHGLVED